MTFFFSMTNFNLKYKFVIVKLFCQLVWPLYVYKSVCVKNVLLYSSGLLHFFCNTSYVSLHMETWLQCTAKILLLSGLQTYSGENVIYAIAYLFYF